MKEFELNFLHRSLTAVTLADLSTDLLPRLEHGRPPVEPGPVSHRRHRDVLSLRRSPVLEPDQTHPGRGGHLLHSAPDRSVQRSEGKTFSFIRF